MSKYDARGSTRPPTASSQNSFSQDQSLDFWAERYWREYLAPMPDNVLTETLERARRLAAEQPRSYLARHLRRLYGVSR